MPKVKKAKYQLRPRARYTPPEEVLAALREEPPSTPPIEVPTPPVEVPTPPAEVPTAPVDGAPLMNSNISQDRELKEVLLSLKDSVDLLNRNAMAAGPSTSTATLHAAGRPPGSKIYLYETKLDLCPIEPLQRFLARRQVMGINPNQPLFMHPSGLPLTKQQLISHVRQLIPPLGYNPAHFSGHSMRIGFATTCAEAGIPDHLIKALGRWTSSCYTIYIKSANNAIAEAHMRVATI